MKSKGKNNTKVYPGEKGKSKEKIFSLILSLLTFLGGLLPKFSEHQHWFFLASFLLLILAIYLILQRFRWAFIMAAFCGIVGAICYYLSIPPKENQSLRSKPIELYEKLDWGAVLPITVPPKESIYVLRCYPGMTDWLYYFANGKDKPVLWPPEVDFNDPKTHNRFETIYPCTITNYGDSPLLDLVLTYDMEFRGPANNTPSPQQFRVGIVALKPSSPFVFYLVNQSKFTVVIYPPKTITGRLSGESERQTMNLKTGKDAMTLLDKLPLVLYPTKIKWTGLPD